MFINPMTKEFREVKNASTKVKPKVAKVNLAKEVLRGLKNSISYRGCNNYFFFVDGSLLLNKVKPSKKFDNDIDYVADLVNKSADLLRKKGYTIDVYNANINLSLDYLIYASVNDIVDNPVAGYNYQVDPIIEAAVAYKNDQTKANADKFNKEIEKGIKNGTIIDHV